ncbi:DNA-processing protein DprA [Modestobacter sp. VKM Ac-2986]|uniref:DNA-processing protein DprA n=1 Tax=Modestobacter sp. VKM Ac-2986 TaxID=3004140 RepID=UPI0022ABB483|nr:DNA-processing protein DprA [Modestobacter sp. VKM Ac-2986]MCZ2829442.1 DNA-processing protein DprA [Modestobacter sp. VKM Ac-2986]
MTADGGGATADVRLARAWLSRAVEPGSVAMWQFVTEAGPVVAAEALRAGRAPAAVQALVGARAQEDVSLDDLARVQRSGGRLVVPEDDEWPAAALHCLTLAALRQQTDDGSRPRDRTTSLVPPLALWVRGDRPLDDLVDRSVALVGSRASTAYGEHVAGELAHGLGERGWTTVSGGAFGIDAAAHRGSLAAGAPTVVVLACGVDRAYPSGHSALFARVLEDGALVSEWPPGCAPLRHRFLVRNRLIAALTRGTVVVEAAARSGAQATAHRARDLGRSVMAVPGPVTSARSVGCHELLRDTERGATLVTTAADVVETVGRVGEDLAAPAERPASARDSLSDVARRVLDACPVRAGVSPERLATVAGCEVLDVLRVLPALELHGLVEWTGTGWRVTPPSRRQ